MLCNWKHAYCHKTKKYCTWLQYRLLDCHRSRRRRLSVDSKRSQSWAGLQEEQEEAELISVDCRCYRSIFVQCCFVTARRGTYRILWLQTHWRSSSVGCSGATPQVSTTLGYLDTRWKGHYLSFHNLIERSFLSIFVWT